MRKLVCLALALSLLLMPGCSRQSSTEGIPGTLGEPVETAFFTFTASGPQWDLEDPDSPQPPEGKRALWVRLEVSNTTGQPQMLYYDEFDLYIDSQARFPERWTSRQQMLEDQLIAAGSSASGYLVYLVPDAAKQLELVYDEYYQDDQPGQRYVIPIPLKEIG